MCVWQSHADTYLRSHTRSARQGVRSSAAGVGTSPGRVSVAVNALALAQRNGAVNRPPDKGTPTWLLGCRFMSAINAPWHAHTHPCPTSIPVNPNSFSPAFIPAMLLKPRRQRPAQACLTLFSRPAPHSSEPHRRRSFPCRLPGQLPKSPEPTHSHHRSGPHLHNAGQSGHVGELLHCRQESAVLRRRQAGRRWVGSW